VTEVEVKLPLASPEEGRRLLEKAGFRVGRQRFFESNVVLDTPSRHLRQNGRLLRVRDEGGVCILAFKGPGQPGRHKTREEVETSAGDRSALLLILSRLGYERSWRYDKFRTEYRGDGDGHVFLDETPVGAFLEIEGSPDWIDQTAAALGFGESDYILLSYGSLYLRHCERTGKTPTDMVFDPA
jgi:adenylate cyclase class 2